MWGEVDPKSGVKTDSGAMKDILNNEARTRGKAYPMSAEEGGGRSWVSSGGTITGLGKLYHRRLSLDNTQQ